MDPTTSSPRSHKRLVTREKHYERRIYTIHLQESGPTSDPNQVQHPQITGPTFDSSDQNQVQDSPEHAQHSHITGPTSGNHPSLPSEEPSREREPSPALGAVYDKPNPLSPSLDPVSKSEPTATAGGQSKTDDVAHVQAECFTLTGKTPKPEHVQALLKKYKVVTVVSAFKDYVWGLKNPRRSRDVHKTLQQIGLEVIDISRPVRQFSSVRNSCDSQTVAKKYHVSRATICRLTNKARGLKSHKGNLEKAAPLTEENNPVASNPTRTLTPVCFSSL
jgi:hypothetical protein